MRLGDWLQRTGTTQKAFADAIGITQGRVSQLIKEGLPSLNQGLDLRERIKTATDGEVDLAEEGDVSVAPNAPTPPNAEVAG